ncbi:hypothetical protein B0H14DRAFT_1309794 [Mycena olivaceomarginata]|nr:hypothetical protein B0H14DRAFT_1309794 [Mycena olivaceomarginata]
MVGSLRGDMDTLLVFASLFSAVVTAFVSESYPGLSGTLERGQLCGPHSTPTSAGAGKNCHDCNNVLQRRFYLLDLDQWLVVSSLVLSLNTVLGAVLVKQWLGEYELVTCSTTRASPRNK